MYGSPRHAALPRRTVPGLAMAAPVPSGRPGAGESPHRSLALASTARARAAAPSGRLGRHARMRTCPHSGERRALRSTGPASPTPAPGRSRSCTGEDGMGCDAAACLVPVGCRPRGLKAVPPLGSRCANRSRHAPSRPATTSRFDCPSLVNCTAPPTGFRASLSRRQQRGASTRHATTPKRRKASRRRRPGRTDGNRTSALHTCPACRRQQWWTQRWSGRGRLEKEPRGHLAHNRSGPARCVGKRRRRFGPRVLELLPVQVDEFKTPSFCHRPPVYIPSPPLP
eukprot:scaffold105511_cov93-Phaeocystis_antarctica.AAC.2